MAKVQFKTREVTSFIIIHCSATRPSQDIGVRTLRQWHKERGYLDVGYHLIITRDGTVEEGRIISQVGAHTKGYNAVSVGVCLVGGVDENMQPEANFTEAQKVALKEVLADLKVKYPDAQIKGHNDFAPKACPSFKVSNYLKTGEMYTFKG
ncbi:N-acetylmuramoyl-L-alanine amidase [Pasteurella phage vB_PmuP_PS07]|uniref:N-acetylmuramoyl-L-alanine amidase n=1 Tax=Pasteurella phage vB_PmuP_Pa7 TaxID=2767198 RepID=A0A7G8ZYQ0_9CAUD|nr:N-acetylmuramoyl-L-alanine amidase [Pasteurella phage vB_PmuP_Pa7]UIS73851.1 N-acetylmuramoyl-L-alanine amidase [Pasteurella phage vB_PmuP_PS07]UIS74031.1 N-acetylmuramoyl-L-alanine amidase [Pasteurella phage vB_PmuP_PS30]